MPPHLSRPDGTLTDPPSASKMLRHSACSRLADLRFLPLHAACKPFFPSVAADPDFEIIRRSWSTRRWIGS